MALNADLAIDRRRLKRGLTVWRIVAIIAIVVAAIALLAELGIDGWIGRSYVARLSVDGIILQDLDREKTLASVAADPAVKALVVHIDSPGGTVVGGESLYRALRAVAAEKPVVAVMGEVATSGGYMTAIGADYIFARSGTITGSIGVILQSVDATELMAKLGLKPESVKSSPLKAQPSPLEPFTPAARQAIEDLVGDTYQMFLGMVMERRGFAPEAAGRLADGRVYTGRQAVENGLIDALGGEAEARAWLASVRGVEPALPIRDLEIRREGRLLRDLFEGTLGKTLFSERLRLDGLIALWHPDLW